MDTFIYYSNPDELVKMGYNYKDCNASFDCPIMEDGAVFPPCQQAVMYQAWECDPEPFIPEEVDHDIKPPYYGPEAAVEVVETTETAEVEYVAETRVEEKPVEVEARSEIEAMPFAGLFALVALVYRLIK